MYEWCMNDVYMARPPKIVIVLSVLPNWNKIVNQSINQSKEIIACGSAEVAGVVTHRDHGCISSPWHPAAAG